MTNSRNPKRGRQGRNAREVSHRGPVEQERSGDRDGNKPAREEPGTRAERTIASFTVVLAILAAVQVCVTALQWNVASRAFWSTEVPHIRLWAEGISCCEGPFRAWGRIANGSQITLFNGKVSGQLGVVEGNAIGIPWNNLARLKPYNLVLGPGDVSTIVLDGNTLQQSDLEAIKARKAVVVVGLKVEYRDGGGDLHNRYVCTFFYYSEGRMNPDGCLTPPQS